MNLLFDFTVDRATHTIYITREFAADIDLVWDAFTKPEILDQWQAPKPWRAQTKEMDFREGGRWLYTMIDPDAPDTPDHLRRYSLAEFIEIKPKTSFTSRNSFADEKGVPLNNISSITKNSFKAAAGITTVHIEKKMNSLEQLEQFIAMGFKDGIAAAMNNLDDYLQNLFVRK